MILIRAGLNPAQFAVLQATVIRELLPRSKVILVDLRKRFLYIIC